MRFFKGRILLEVSSEFEDFLVNLSSHVTLLHNDSITISSTQVVIMLNKCQFSIEKVVLHLTLGEKFKTLFSLDIESGKRQVTQHSGENLLILLLTQIWYLLQEVNELLHSLYNLTPSKDRNSL